MKTEAQILADLQEIERQNNGGTRRALYDLEHIHEFLALLEAAEPHAIRALVDVAMNSKSDAARVAAANSLIDRKRGKPVQQIDQTIDQRITHVEILVNGEPLKFESPSETADGPSKLRH